MKKMKMVLVEWRDAYGCNTDWTELENMRPKSMLVKSVGWLVVDGKDYKVVVPHLCLGDGVSRTSYGMGDITIPVKAIIKIRTLSH